jgi:hypothetical protein
MVGAEYRYPIKSKFVIFGGVAMGPAIGIFTGYHHGDDEFVAFVTDILLGVQMGKLYINPKFHILNYDGDSYSAFELSVGVNF